MTTPRVLVRLESLALAAAAVVFRLGHIAVDRTLGCGLKCGSGLRDGLLGRL